MGNAPSGKKVGKTILKTVLWITGIWAAVLIVVQIILSPSFLTKVLNEFSDDYIDGDLRFGKAEVSVFRHFPNIALTLSDVSLTYPGDRFAEYEGEGDGHRLLAAGKGVETDTLASFGRLSVTLNAASLIAGKINIPHIHLTGPRIFAKNYDEAIANWNIFKSSGEEDDESEDDSSFGLPDISAGKIILDGHPLIVYCSRPDTIGAAVRLDKLSVTKHRKHYGLDLHARTGVSMPSVGRVMIPLEVKSNVSFPEDTVPAVQISRFNARIAGIPLKAEADVRYHTDRVLLKAAAEIDRCKVSDVLNYFGKNIWDGASEIETDAVIDLKVNADGWYAFDGSMLPAFDAALYIPESDLKHKGLGFDSRIAADILADGRNPEAAGVTVKNLHIDSEGLCLHFAGAADDIFGDDPLFTIDGDLMVSLDTLAGFLDPEHGIKASGTLEAEAEGQIKLSQMDIYRFAEADLKGSVKSARLDLSSEKDTLRVHLDSLDAVFATTSLPKMGDGTEGKRIIALSASLDSLRAGYKHAFAVKGSNWSFKAQNDAAILDPEDSSSYYPFGGRLEIESLSLMGSDSMRVNLKNSSSTFMMLPSPGNRNLPVMTLKSDNGSIRMSAAGNRLSARNMKLDITATKNPASASGPNRREVKKFTDSLARRHPDIPRDSLLSHIRNTRGSQSIPEWLSEADFRKSDIDFRIDESIANYYRDWNFNGSMSIKRASVMTPMFPLRTTVSNFDGKIDNNSVDIKSFKVTSGTSDLSATGKLTGLRRALLSNGAVNLNVKMKSGRLNVNELVGAWMAGRSADTEELASKSDSMSDDEYEKMFITDTLTNKIPETALLVIPANVNAEISLEASNVTYGKFELDRASSEISMRERCVLLKNTVASTNLGDIAFEGFYSTRTKKDIKTGFNMNLSNVTAEKVIEMMPSVDTLMPMIKSFKGLLNCEVAATAQIDTAMNIIMPTLNGVIRIGGKNLGLKETEDLYKILRLLRFKNIHSINIDKMSVEGIISDNTLEIFPFVVAVDRYTLAMSGLQNMDQTFKYHVSILKSPLLIRFGVDLYGNFDDFKFKIGKAKYKSKKVPVFSSVVDETKLNLSQTIRNIFSKGVDEALKENAKMTIINEHKLNIGYRNEATTQIEELSASETRKLESEEERDENTPDDEDEEVETSEQETDTDNLTEN